MEDDFAQRLLMLGAKRAFQMPSQQRWDQRSVELRCSSLASAARELTGPGAGGSGPSWEARKLLGGANIKAEALANSASPHLPDPFAWLRAAVLPVTRWGLGRWGPGSSCEGTQAGFTRGSRLRHVCQGVPSSLEWGHGLARGRGQWPVREEPGETEGLEGAVPAGPGGSGGAGVGRSCQAAWGLPRGCG